MKLTKITEIKGKIVLKSGLHIGGGDLEMRIGGTDNQVVKHPHTQEPYIPGSSIKGKVRSLLEMKSGLMGETSGRPLGLKHLKDLQGAQREEGEKILRLFGTSGADGDEAARLGPTRVSFADCSLSDSWRALAAQRHLPLTEVKSENWIDRIRGVAKDPRFTERVPADTVFDFSVTLKNLNEDDDLLDYLLEGLKLLEMDALGGSGSRGYGRIRFELEDENLRERFASIMPLEKEG
ncbi:MAG: type III-A CRISPR-associated RAMP protein Csm3 [Deltaproteobacteria bacterium]|jgi:CRISPR-associated protein Csm3|nr:type III-A CRISPR-associated RAMP protein Csm3 [Deltaproteobacteria bacterium]